MGLHLYIAANRIDSIRPAFVLRLHRFRSLQGDHVEAIIFIFQDHPGSRADRQAFCLSGYRNTRLLCNIFFCAQRNAVSGQCRIHAQRAGLILCLCNPPYFCIHIQGQAGRTVCNFHITGNNRLIASCRRDPVHNNTRERIVSACQDCAVPHSYIGLVCNQPAVFAFTDIVPGC